MFYILVKFCVGRASVVHLSRDPFDTSNSQTPITQTSTSPNYIPTLKIAETTKNSKTEMFKISTLEQRDKLRR